MAKNKRKGLGNLGVDILLSSKAKVEPTTVDPGTTSKPGNDGLSYIGIDLVDRSPYQPRQTISQEGVEELADSIRTQGLIQPIVVRKTNDRYELIAGERRWRAAQLAGLQEIPAVVKQVDDEAAAAMALVENLQREDLNPVEEAVAVSNLIKQFEWTHQEVADAIGKARATISNMLRLLELSSEIHTLIQLKQLTMGHARALLSLPQAEQGKAAEVIISKQLSVRQTEQLIKKIYSEGNNQAKTAVKKDANIQDLENRIADRLGAAVGIQHNEKTSRGKIQIHYNDLDELEGILHKIGS